jgi:hypothetical protein
MISIPLDYQQMVRPATTVEVVLVMDYAPKPAASVSTTVDATDPDEIEAQKRRNGFGIHKGKCWMAPDFDETPEDFKEYL